MKIIKRSGTEVVFDIDKIVNAIRAANLEVEESSRLTDRQVVYAAQNVAEACENAGHTVSVEEIQDLVEDEIMRLDCYEVARHYIIYRYVQSLKRQIGGDGVIGQCVDVGFESAAGDAKSGHDQTRHRDVRRCHRFR